MRKEALLILTVLLFATCSYAACDITATIDKGVSKSYLANGNYYTIKFSSLANESGSLVVKFEVNGESTPELEKGDKHIFDDLSEITISDISKGSGSVNDSAKICFTTGLSGLEGTCSSNEDCDDNNPCTIDECDGDPLRCRRTLILWCRDNDGCCPQARCTAENDNDCKKTSEPVNDSLIDNSSLINKTIVECVSGDDYCPQNCTFKEDNDCNECSTDEECNDNNICTIDICSGTPTRCSNSATAGCDLNGNCISIGTRTEDKFCNKDSILESLRSKKEYCDNDYECLSNSCIKNKCKGISFIKKIFSWFGGLFS